MNEVLKAIKNRRSVRRYKPEQISEADLEMILEAGMYAPTAHNEQPWHFTVIQNPELLSLMNEKAKEEMAKSDVDWIHSWGLNPNYKVIYDAPTLIVVSGRKDGMAWQVDCAAAIENMLIAAESLNIGSVWLGLMNYYLRLDGAAAKLGIPEGYEPFYAVAFGRKADEEPKAGPKRNKNVVNYIR